MNYEFEGNAFRLFTIYDLRFTAVIRNFLSIFPQAEAHGIECRQAATGGHRRLAPHGKPDYLIQGHGIGQVGVSPLPSVSAASA